MTTDFDVVWTGATWRSYPPPVLAEPVIQTQGGRGPGYRQRVIAVLTGPQWVSVQYLADKTGLTERQLSTVLSRMTAAGYLDEQMVPGRGCRRKLVRRRQTQAQEAA